MRWIGSNEAKGMKQGNVEKMVAELRSDPEYEDAFATVDLVRAASEMLTRMRVRARMTQSDLAEALGMTPGRVWQLESGLLRHAASLKTIARWAQACGEAVTIRATGDPALELPEAGSRQLIKWAGGARIMAQHRAMLAAAQAARNAAEETWRKEAGHEDAIVVASEPQERDDSVEFQLTFRPLQSRYPAARR